MEVADWIGLGSAVAAAIAAIAAATAAYLQLQGMREQRLPHLSSVNTISLQSGAAFVTIANAGPGMAIQASYFVVDGGQKAGGLIGSGYLPAAREATVRLGLAVSARPAPLTMVYLCSDYRWNTHVWSNDGRYTRIPRKRVLAHDRTTLGDMFKEMYPKVPVPS